VKGSVKGYAPSEFDISFFREDDTEEELKRDEVPLYKKSSPWQGGGDRVNKIEILCGDN
jgi:hypothetical protein